MITYVVTGGAGFIGANFIHYLFKTYGDECRVINIDCLTYAGNLHNLEGCDDKPNYRFIKADICDSESLLAALKGESIDYFINFAAESHVDRSILGSGPFVQTNIVGTQRLLDLARLLDVKRYVQVSTDEVYGELEATGFFVEETPLQPNSPYSASKAAGDLLVRSYHETHKMPVVITRCSNNYGPYQFPEKLIPLMISNALEGTSLPIYGTGLNVRDWIYVEDHCRGVDMAARKGTSGQVYNFGGDSERTNLDVVKRILKTLDKPESLMTYVEDRKGHDFRYAIDFSKATRDLGWKPAVDFETGIELTIAWYLENRTWWECIKSGDYQAYYEKMYTKR
jgi:dTDP-glucose 4,6-dehydratase